MFVHLYARYAEYDTGTCCWLEGVSTNVVGWRECQPELNDAGEIRSKGNRLKNTVACDDHFRLNSV